MDLELNTNLILITSLVFAFMLNASFKWFSKKQGPMAAMKLPQSPSALPFIGHLHLIGKVLPVSFQSLARKYGPLLEIRLGASKCVLVSSSSVAREIFKEQELNFSSRPEFGSAEYFKYSGSRFVLAQYGDYWRFMKKLCMTKLLAVPQLEKFADIRDEEKLKLVESVAKCCREGLPCDLSSQFVTYTNNVICRMAMSTRCSGTDNEAEEIRKLVKTCLELAGKISVGDVLGPLKLLDISGNGRKLVAVMEKYDLRDPTAEMKLTRNDMKSFLLDVFMAGTDTSSAAMQWAMGLLRAVLRETLRLHPSAPLIIRECAEDCQVNGCLPFGSGRRGCPGASLAMNVMHIGVGSLVQRFNWKSADGQKVDLRQGSGFAAEMARPLVCNPVDRFNTF